LRTIAFIQYSIGLIADGGFQLVSSMTGFGKASHAFQGSMISIELSSVNHRYLDTSLRIPGEWTALDPILRETVKNFLSRGKVNITVSRKRNNGHDTQLKLDMDVARQYLDAANELKELLGTDDSLNLNTLAQFTGVFGYEEESIDLDSLQKALVETLKEALEQLNGMRINEGKKLAVELVERLEIIRDLVEQVKVRLPEINTIYENRIKNRIQEICVENDVAEDRLAMEVAIMAEKGDVTEELVRLYSHLDHAMEMIESKEPVGRKLNFLAQEIQREINTLGSKVRDTDVVRFVLEMKSELEKFREQIQNIE
jgi:uncharacterized protein (TIGR00255 family)